MTRRTIIFYRVGTNGILTQNFHVALGAASTGQVIYRAVNGKPWKPHRTR